MVVLKNTCAVESIHYILQSQCFRTTGRSTNVASVQWSQSNPIYMKYNALHNTADSVSVWLLDVCYTAAQFTFTEHLLLVSLDLQ